MKNILYTLILLISFVSFGQRRSGIELCLFLQQSTSQFASPSIANNALSRILEINNLKGNFILVPCDQISNVVAMTYNGTRYILYDEEFMASLNNSSNVTNLTILAHEIGHHVNGHVKDIIAVKNGKSSPKSIAENRQQELEADEFAGFTLSKLGVKIKQVNKVFQSITNDDINTYSTHPPLSQRLAAVKKGYDNNNKIFNNRVQSQGQQLIKSPTLYYLKISDLYRQEKYIEADRLAEEAIKKHPYNTDLYYWQAKSIFSNIDDYIDRDLNLRLIIELYDKAISLDPDYFAFYFWRGSAKLWLGDYSGAIEDLEKSMLLKSFYKGDTDSFSKEEENIYVIKGLAHFESANYSDAISDLNRAFDLGFKYLENPLSYEKEKIYVRQLLSKSFMYEGDYSNALKNINKDIISNPENIESYRIKAIIIGYIKGYEEFDKSYQIYLQKLKINDSYDYYKKSFGYVNFILDLFYDMTYSSKDLNEIKKRKFNKISYSEDFKENQLNRAENILIKLLNEPEIKKIVDNNDGKNVSANYSDINMIYNRLLYISEIKQTDSNIRLEIAEKKLIFAGLGYDEDLEMEIILRNDEEQVLYLKKKSLFDKIQANNLVGEIKVKLGKFEEAIFNFNKMIMLFKQMEVFQDDSNPIELDYAYYNLASCKRESGDPNGAIQEYNNALKINPNNLNYIGERGTAKQYLNNLYGACDDWNKAVSLGGGEYYKQKISKFCNLNSSINSEKSPKEKAIEELKKIKELLDLDLITQEEFTKKAAELKKVILGN